MTENDYRYIVAMSHKVFNILKSFNMTYDARTKYEITQQSVQDDLQERFLHIQKKYPEATDLEIKKMFYTTAKNLRRDYCRKMAGLYTKAMVGRPTNNINFMVDNKEEFMRLFFKMTYGELANYYGVNSGTVMTWAGILLGEQSKKFSPDIEEFEELTTLMSVEEMAEYYDVSVGAISEFAQKIEVPLAFRPCVEEFTKLAPIMTVRQLADFYGTGLATISEYAKEKGIELTKPFEPDPDEFRELCSRMSIADVAKHYEVSYRQAYWFANKIKV